MNCRLIYVHLFHDPDFCTLPAKVQVALIACMCSTDDWGRGRTIDIAALGKLDIAALAEAKRLIAATGILRFYGKDGCYYYAPKFFTYQRISHPKASQIPAPPDTEFEASSRLHLERVQAKRRKNAARQATHRARRSDEPIATELDGDDITSPEPTPVTSGDPASRRCGAAPLDLPPRLRDAFSEIVSAHGVSIAGRALKAARRWFPMPTEKQLAQVLQAAAEEGLLESDPEVWPDFRNRIDEARAREINPAGAQASAADRAVYARFGKRVQP